LNPRQRSPRWRDLTKIEIASTSAHRVPSTLIADYEREREKRKYLHCKKYRMRPTSKWEVSLHGDLKNQLLSKRGLNLLKNWTV
jgi:hypothetical protein